VEGVVIATVVSSVEHGEEAIGVVGVAERMQAHRAEVGVGVLARKCAVDGVGLVVVIVDVAGGVVQSEAILVDGVDRGRQGGERQQSGDGPREEGDGDEQGQGQRLLLGCCCDAARCRRDAVDGNPSLVDGRSAEEERLEVVADGRQGRQR